MLELKSQSQQGNSSKEKMKMSAFFFIVFLAYKDRSEVLDTYSWMKYSPSCWVLIFFFYRCFSKLSFLSQNGPLPYIDDGIDTKKSIILSCNYILEFFNFC